MVRIMTTGQLVLVEVPADVAGWYLLPVVPLPLALPSL
jgi:hypothetical protein